MKALGLSSDCDLKALEEKYAATQQYFALIASVLNGRQAGEIYSDNLSGNYFIVHQFGFADLIESKRNDEFDKYLYEFIIHKQFEQQKLRWYCVPERWVELLKSCGDEKIAIVERVKLIRNCSDVVPSNTNLDTVIKNITHENFDEVNQELEMNLERRFWQSKSRFLRHSFGAVAYVSGKPAAICYACAIERGVAEVDVFTKEQFRRNGLGKLVAAEFVNMCAAKNIHPHWDCYSNNQPSLNLAASLGFIAIGIYNHAIICK